MALSERRRDLTMFRIRRIYDNTLHINKEAVVQVQAILKQQFPGLTRDEIEALPFPIRDQQLPGLGNARSFLV
jgi:hypothetical protein